MKLRKRWIGAVILLLLIWGGYKVTLSPKLDMAFEGERLNAEQFIIDHFMKPDGRIQTDLTKQTDVYLSETVGLWMEYLVAKGDLREFGRQVRVLEKYFLTKDYLVVWELQGKVKAPANASIDDLRIMNALFAAGEKWNESAYTKLAMKMADSLRGYQIREGLMVDYVDLKDKHQASVLTLSYIIPSAFERLKEHQFISQMIYDDTVALLVELPQSAIGFFPKSYDVQKKSYSFDEDVNLIDQFYIGYHRVQWGGNVTPLLEFMKTELTKGKGKLFGRYDAKTGMPTVDYEAPAVYALAVLMCLEIGEVDLARQLFAQMQTLQENDESSDYFGGYIDIPSFSTHTFDNLLALIAERKGIDEEIF